MFFPCMESYRRGKEDFAIVPIFPGYIFIRTDLTIEELHDLIAQKRRENLINVKELGLKDRLAEMNKDLPEGTDARDDYVVSDLNEEEERFLDFMLGENEDGTGEGLLRMSYGYKEGDRYIVMKGPLKAYENRIAAVNMHDRKAYLDIRVRDRMVKAGFEVKPKKYWFPDEAEEGVLLNDGTEINLDELKKSMESRLT